jgi:DNA-binding MarR family transcriptional regulator
MSEIILSTPDRDALTGRIARHIMRWQEVTQRYDDLVGERLGLSSSELQCLSVVHDGPKPAGVIARAIGLTPAAVTSLVDRLETRGLVARTRDAGDRRKVLVEMTPEARKISVRYYEPLARDGYEHLSRFTDQELTVIERFLAAAVGVQGKHLERLSAEQTADESGAAD